MAGAADSINATISDHMCPFSALNDLADGGLEQSVFASQGLLTDATGGIAASNIPYFRLCQLSASSPFTPCRAPALSHPKQISSMGIGQQVRRSHAADVSTITEMSYLRCLDRRLVAGRQDVGDDVGEPLLALKAKRASSIRAGTAPPDPARAEVGANNGAFLVDPVPEPRFDRAIATCHAAKESSLSFGRNEPEDFPASLTGQWDTMSAHRLSPSGGVTPPAVTSSAGALCCVQSGRDSNPRATAYRASITHAPTLDGVNLWPVSVTPRTHPNYTAYQIGRAA